MKRKVVMTYKELEINAEITLRERKMIRGHFPRW